MKIEDALRAIAENEPVVASETDGSLFCVYCDGEYTYEIGIKGSGKFVHHDCPWEYLKQNIEEDERIEKLLHDNLDYRGYSHIINGLDQDCRFCRSKVER